MGRPRKIKEENIEIEEKVVDKEVEIEKENTKIPSFEDLMTPENMMKMFAVFKQMESMQQQVTNDNKEEKVEHISEKKQDSKYERFTKARLMKIKDEEVVVRSVVDNVSFTSPMTKIKYRSRKKGAVQPLPISEILAMDNTSTRFLFTPWVVVEDERVIEAFGLGRIYELISKVEDISQLINFSKEEIESIFNELPKHYQNSFKNEIFRKVRTRELNDLKIIDILSQVLHIDLNNIESEEELIKRK
jgi:hypothetical protein